MTSALTPQDQLVISDIYTKLGLLDGALAKLEFDNVGPAFQSYLNETHTPFTLTGAVIAKITGTMRLSCSSGNEKPSLVYVAGKRMFIENRTTASHYAIEIPPTDSSGYRRHIVVLDANGTFRLISSAYNTDYDFAGLTSNLLMLALVHVPANTSGNLDSGSVTITDYRQYYARGAVLPLNFPAGKIYTLTHTDGSFAAGTWLKTNSTWVSVSTSASTLSVPLGGTGLTTIPAGRIMYGNDASAVATSANLTFNATGSPSGTGNLIVSGIFTSAGTTGANAPRISLLSSGFWTWGIVGDGNNLNFLYDSTVGMSLTSAGNLGIGTPSPLAKLDVRGLVAAFGSNQGFVAVGVGSDLTNYESLTCSHAGANGARFISSGGGTGTVRNFEWITWNGSTVGNLMTLTASGNLGVGTTSPQCNLHTRANGSGLQEVARFTANYSATNSGPLIRFTNIVAGGTNPNTNEYNLAGIGAYDHSSNWGGGLHFYTAPNGTTGGANLSLAMTLTPAGNLGVGTNSPLGRIDARATSGSQIVASYDASNAFGISVTSTGATNAQLNGSSPFYTLRGDAAPLVSVESRVENVNANAYGALSSYWTEGGVRGHIGALKHGSASPVLFVGETTDGFGIRANTVLEFGIGPTGIGIGRWNTGGLTVGGLVDSITRLDSLRDGYQLLLGRLSSSAIYSAFHCNSDGNLIIATSSSIVINAERFVFTVDGKLGVNTVSPSATLHVAGSSLRVDQTPAGSAGSATGTFMTINLNGTDYKIALLANA